MRPPATSTCPDLSNVALWLYRLSFIFPVAVQVPVASSYSSQESSPGAPPATSTLPLSSRLAVCRLRAAVIFPVVSHPGSTSRG